MIILTYAEICKRRGDLNPDFGHSLSEKLPETGSEMRLG